MTIKLNGCITTRDVYILFGVDFKGKKKYLTYDIKYNDNSKFWLEITKILKAKDIDKIMYFVTEDIEHSKRAFEISFS